jgi:hypothetical protein
VPVEPCPRPQPLAGDVVFDEGLTRLHRAATAFAESAVALRSILQTAEDFAPGWGAREPVASAVYRLQADLYTLADLTETTFAQDGATYSPDGGWAFPDGYPLAALAAPWEQIPAFQAVVLTDLFTADGRDAAAALFDTGVCSLVAAFSAAVDQSAAAGG